MFRESSSGDDKAQRNVNVCHVEMANKHLYDTDQCHESTLATPGLSTLASSSRHVVNPVRNPVGQLRTILAEWEVAS